MCGTRDPLTIPRYIILDIRTPKIDVQYPEVYEDTYTTTFPYLKKKIHLINCKSTQRSKRQKNLPYFTAIHNASQETSVSNVTWVVFEKEKKKIL